MNIYEKLSKITEELETVKKSLTVGSGNYGYKAVGEMDILNAVKPLEVKYGVYSYPMNRKVITSEVIDTMKNDKVSTKFFLRIETTYRFINIDEPSEFVDQVSYGDGVDPLDKAPGKAMTYSDKYSLMKAYKIMTGDDPDQKHSKDTTVTRTTKKVVEDISITYKKILDLKLSAEDVKKWEDYYKVNSILDLDSEQMNFIIERFSKRLGK